MPANWPASMDLSPLPQSECRRHPSVTAATELRASAVTADVHRCSGLLVFRCLLPGGRVRAAGPAGEDLSWPTVQGFHRYPLTPLEIAEFDGALTRSA
jgi:hypothetical protein